VIQAAKDFVPYPHPQKICWAPSFKNAARSHRFLRKGPSMSAWACSIAMSVPSFLDVYFSSSCSRHLSSSTPPHVSPVPLLQQHDHLHQVSSWTKQHWPDQLSKRSSWVAPIHLYLTTMVFHHTQIGESLPPEPPADRWYIAPSVITDGDATVYKPTPPTRISKVSTVIFLSTQSPEHIPSNPK
jgi:hypothetical protein